MSKIGVKPIEIPNNINIELNENLIKVKGPKGELYLNFDKSKVEVVKENNILKFIPFNKKEKRYKEYWGTIKRHVENMIKGVTEGFEKKLVVEGIGYRANIQNNKLILTVGFANPLEVEIPKELQVSVKENVITISGIDKAKVGQFAAYVRALKKPDVYRGKGIRYIDEKIKFKVGKAGV
jgi:large subunit ribosomal protein L6